MTKVIGLTGSIAVGKSTVSNGYCVLDADEISRHALDQGTECFKQVINLFDCLDEKGSIDRKKLGNIVFHNAYKKRQLENIIHPYVIEQLKIGIRTCQDELIFCNIR